MPLLAPLQLFAVSVLYCVLYCTILYTVLLSVSVKW